MGTNETNADVFPEHQVGYNNSGKIEISGEGLALNADDPNAAHGNLSDVRERSKREAHHSQFFMEPGR